MLIVWRGWGIVVLPIALAAMFLAVGLVQETGVQNPSVVGLIYVAFSALAALGIWLLVNHLEGGEGQVFIEKSTGREIEVKGDAGSLFFVPTRYWAYIVVAAGVFAAVQVALHPGAVARF
jgi:hypothetical protein